MVAVAQSVRNWAEKQGSQFKPQYTLNMEGVLVVEEGVGTTRALPKYPFAMYQTPKFSYWAL